MQISTLYSTCRQFPAVLVLTIVGLSAGGAWAQSSSLMGSPETRQPLTLSQYSWTYLPVEEPRVIRLNDLITVIVDEKAEMVSEGKLDRRRKMDGLWSLKDWIMLLDGKIGIRPDPQTAGDPTISHTADGKYRAEGGLETRESMKFRITCRVVDVRPNGNLVLEGRRVIQNNEESWEVSFGGVVRAEDILPNNTILSENVAEPRIGKREGGVVRDGYRPGWLIKWRDRYKPL